MRISQKSIVEQPIEPQSLSYLFNAEWNKIGERGCEHLTQAKWNHLLYLNLCSNYLIEGGNSIGDV